jgi:hypothetical protein
MARKKLSVQGRVVAAGVSVAVAGALAGFMASGDHTADATQPATTSDPTRASNGIGSSDPSSSGSATPFPDDQRDTGSGTSQIPAQPQTRTGGS